MSGVKSTPASPPPALATSPNAEPPPRNNAGAIGGGLLLGAGALLFGLVAIVAVVVALWFLARPEEPVVQVPPPVVAPAVPVPVPVTVPVPVPIEEPAAAPMIEITSVPPGAEVWEGPARLCTTPCKTEHPDHAPLPRVFTLKSAGYLDTNYEMADPSVPHEVRLDRNVPVAKPQPAQRLPKINIER